ncbi:MAG: polysaccharide biosynthesis C-terminal domain-containing protein [Bacteroidales bacterium]|nr:polysaccharide biosynthesis C-terminal domain-containing protein [Bacteroidales bacterium]
MKQKDFVFNLCLLLFLNLLIKPFWILAIDVGVQNQVGVAAYGMYFAIFNFTFMFNILLDMGTTNFNNRNIARNTQLLDKHLSSIIILRLLLAAGYFIIVFAIALCIGYRGQMLKILFWTAINQFLNTFMLYLRSNISALLMFKTDSVLSVLDRLLMILFCGMLLWGNITKQPFQIEWFIYSQTAAYSIAVLVALCIVLYKSHLRQLHWNMPFFLMILKKSLPFALLTMLMACYNRIDSVMIERLLPDSIAAEQAGIYASAFRLLDALVMIAYLFSVILLPLFSKMLKAKDDIHPIIRTSFSLLYFFAISATVILLCYKEPILSFLYNEHVNASVQVFSLLIPGIIPIAFTYIFGTLLTANGSMKLLNFTAAVGIIVNIIINLILIPKMQARGAAVASLCTQSVVSILQFAIALHELKVPIKIMPWLSCLIFTLLLIPTSIFSTRIATQHIIYPLCLMAIAATLFGFASGLLNLKGFKHFRQRA